MSLINMGRVSGRVLLTVRARNYDQPKGPQEAAQAGEGAGNVVSYHPEVASLLKYINATPQLQSVLYDLDLLPEQLEEGSLDWRRMLQLTLWHKCVIQVEQQEKP